MGGVWRRRWSPRGVRGGFLGGVRYSNFDVIAQTLELAGLSLELSGAFLLLHLEGGLGALQQLGYLREGDTRKTTV